MAVIILEEILDPIGNQKNHTPKLVLYAHQLGIKSVYGIKVHWGLKDEQQSIHYHVAMHCTERKDGNELWRLRKTNMFVNGETPSARMYELALACAMAYGPVAILVNRQGQQATIGNQSEMTGCFIANRPALQRDFAGPFAENYIFQMEDALQNKQKLLDLLVQDLWLTLFFANIYTAYDHGTQSKEMQLRLPLLGFGEALIFDGLVTIDFTPNSFATCTLCFNGKLDLEAIPMDVQQLYTISGGSVLLTYHVEQTEKYIREIVCQATLATAKGDYKLQLSGCSMAKNKLRTKPAPPPPVVPKKKGRSLIDILWGWG